MRSLTLLLLLGLTANLLAGTTSDAPLYLVIELKKQADTPAAKVLRQSLKGYGKVTSAESVRVKLVKLRQQDRTRRYLVVRQFANKRTANAFYKTFKKGLPKASRKQIRKSFVLNKADYKAQKREKRLRG